MDSDFTWSVRVEGRGPDESRAHARTHSFGVGRAASFRDSDPHPSALEYLLAALGGDLASGWYRACERAGIVVDALELSLSCTLDNPLRHLGVVGEEGAAALGSLTGTLYVTAEASEDTLREVWGEVLDRSPLYATLSQAVKVSLEFRIVR